MAKKRSIRIKHVRLEFPEKFHARLRRQAERFRLSISAYVRLCVTERVERDERSAEGAE